MPPTDSIRELIMKNLKTTLETIIAGETYANTIKSVQRFDDRSNVTFDAPYIVLIPDDEDKEPVPDPGVTCNLPVMIDLFVRQDATDLLSTDERINSLLADIETAIMADTTRGGYAIDTDILGNSPYSKTEGQPNSGITIKILVEYQHLRTNPLQTGY